MTQPGKLKECEKSQRTPLVLQEKFEKHVENNCDTWCGKELLIIQSLQNSPGPGYGIVFPKPCICSWIPFDVNNLISGATLGSVERLFQAQQFTCCSIGPTHPCHPETCQMGTTDPWIMRTNTDLSLQSLQACGLRNGSCMESQAVIWLRDLPMRGW